MPQAEHSVRVSVRDSGRAAAVTAPAGLPISARLALHSLQRLGSFLNCLSKKNSCSPAVKTNSVPQSEHFRSLSVNSMEPSPSMWDKDETFCSVAYRRLPRAYSSLYFGSYGARVHSRHPETQGCLIWC